MLRAIAIALGLSALAPNAAAENWADLVPVDASTMPDFQNYRADRPDGYRAASGDFDGDGREDGASFYIIGADLVLALRLANAPQAPVVIWRGAAADAHYMGVQLAPVGVYPTACKRYWGCEPGEREEVRLTHDALVLWTFEGPAGFLYFRNDEGAFESELIWE